MTNPPLSINEICALSKRSRMTIYAAINAGHLKTFLVGRQRFARESAVQAWFDFLEKQSNKGNPVIYRPRNSEGRA